MYHYERHGCALQVCCSMHMFHTLLASVSHYVLQTGKIVWTPEKMWYYYSVFLSFSLNHLIWGTHLSLGVTQKFSNHKHAKPKVWVWPSCACIFVFSLYGYQESMIDRGSYAHNLSSCEIKAWKKFRPERDSNPWPLWYWCSALPTELSSLLGAGHFVSS